MSTTEIDELRAEVAALHRRVERAEQMALAALGVPPVFAPNPAPDPLLPVRAAAGETDEDDEIGGAS